MPLTIRDSTPTFAGFCSRLKIELYNRVYGENSTLVIGFYKRGGGHKSPHSFIHSSLVEGICGSRLVQLVQFYQVKVHLT